MLAFLRLAARLAETLIAIPLHGVRLFFSALLFNPRLGRLRVITAPVILYVIFALLLVYVYAPLRGLSGQVWMSDVLRYADERSLGTAIYDKHARFVGIFDPVLDSQRDFNHTGKPIALPDYIAYPDHKSLHVGEVPEAYWHCLALQEDRHLNSLLNPFGIDLFGVLKIPWSTVQRSIANGRPQLGAGGSTLSMQLARIFFKTPPSKNESALEKLSRKAKEWWLAPVIHWELTKGGDIEPLKRWSANHFPHAQRTGGQALYGVEQASLIVFGKGAEALSAAEQFVLAAAVNQPIILLEGGPRLNALRESTWRRIVSQRARYCAHSLIGTPAARALVLSELEALAETAPSPKTPPKIASALETLRPASATPAQANPIRRSNTLIPSAKYGVRDELKNAHGFAWRAHAGSVHLTLDVAKNLAFRRRIQDAAARLEARHKGRIDPRYTLDVNRTREPGGERLKSVPDIVVAAADDQGRIVRYYESNYTAAYFGSARARDPASGRYRPEREARFIASLAKIAAATAIANEGADTAATNYLDTAAPKTGLEACRRGRERRLRSAEVAFACSLNQPLEWRLSQLGPSRLTRVIDDFGLTLSDRETPPERALAVGHLAASPRTVHHMAAMVLAALIGRNAAPRQPSLLQRDDAPSAGPRDLDQMINPDGRSLLARLLSAPLCYRHGTLARLSDWCAEGRDDVDLHFAKTGTRGTGAQARDAYDTVDLWVAGGLKFADGRAYSYVVLIGTGSPAQPWARDLYAGRTAEPLVRALLDDLAGDEILARRPEASAPAPGKAPPTTLPSPDRPATVSPPTELPPSEVPPIARPPVPERQAARSTAAVTTAQRGRP